MTLPVAILAGGAATRLGDIARQTPKSLLDINGQPFVVHQLELLRRSGVTDVLLCVGHLASSIESALGDGSRVGVRVRYSYDGPTPLGTGGALRRALPLLGEAFFVMYGDSYLECDYGAIEQAFRNSGKPGLMTVFRNDDRWDRSNVVCRDGRIVRYSKTQRTPDMRHIDYGLGVLEANIVARYSDGQPLDLATVYEDLVAGGELAAHEVNSRFYEIGTPEGLAETRSHLAHVQPAAVRT